MQRKYGIWRAAAGIMLALVVSANGAHAQPHPVEAPSPRTLTIGADVWCPINCDPKDSENGISIDLARKVFEPLGYQVRYVVMPWARALQEVRAGTLDAVVGASPNDDPTLLFPKHPLAEITDDFYARAENPPAYEGIHSLHGQRLGIIKDYGYHPHVKRLLDNSRKTPGLVQEVGGDDALEQNIRKLLAGRIDVIIESAAVMDYTLKRLNLDQRIRRVGGIRQGYVYVAFSPALPSSKTRIKEYDAGIARLEAGGKLRDLYAPYGLRLP